MRETRKRMPTETDLFLWVEEDLFFPPFPFLVFVYREQSPSLQAVFLVRLSSSASPSCPPPVRPSAFSSQVLLLSSTRASFLPGAGHNFSSFLSFLRAFFRYPFLPPLINAVLLKGLRAFRLFSLLRECRARLFALQRKVPAIAFFSRMPLIFRRY